MVREVVLAGGVEDLREEVLEVVEGALDFNRGDAVDLLKVVIEGLFSSGDGDVDLI